MSAETRRVTDQARYGSTWEADIRGFLWVQYHLYMHTVQRHTCRHNITQNYLNKVLKIESQKKVKACKQSALVKTAHTLTLGLSGSSEEPQSEAAPKFSQSVRQDACPKASHEEFEEESTQRHFTTLLPQHDFCHGQKLPRLALTSHDVMVAFWRR